MSENNVLHHHEDSEPSSSLVKILAWLIVLIFVGAVIWSYFFFQGTVSEEKTRKESMAIVMDVDRLHVYEAEQLAVLKWANQKTNTVKIPIDIAMKYVVRSYQNN